jgi:hypothetical protein
VQVFEGGFDQEFDESDQFHFTGAVKTSEYANLYNTSRPVIDSELTTYCDLTFSRRTHEVLSFKLPFKHPGHEWFKGCSGAPLLDSSGGLVGIVTSGNLETDEIHCVSLRTLLPIIAVTV